MIKRNKTKEAVASPSVPHPLQPGQPGKLLFLTGFPKSQFLTGFAKSQPSLSHISFVDLRPPRWNNHICPDPKIHLTRPVQTGAACTLIRTPGISARLILGPPGCGKSTMASLISKRENRVFYEGKLFCQEFIAGRKVWKLIFFQGDGFLLGFNPYISPEENQANIEAIKNADAVQKALFFYWILWLTWYFWNTDDES